MLYVINYATWTVEETDNPNISGRKYPTRLDALEEMRIALRNKLKNVSGDNSNYAIALYDSLFECDEQIKIIKNETT